MSKWTGLFCLFSVDGLGLNLWKFEKKIEKLSFGFRKKKPTYEAIIPPALPKS